MNQFPVRGPHHTRRPDRILFVNCLPLVLPELKQPADEDADIWKPYDQIQTCKEQIAGVFHYNELMIVSDGSEARFGSLSANGERSMQRRAPCVNERSRGDLRSSLPPAPDRHRQTG